MKYFAKYLPVEGEIKSGWLEVAGVMGKYRNEDDKFIYIQTPDGHVWSRKKEGARTYYKLFLCSRDIQVGDKAWFQLTKHSPLKELPCIDKDIEGIILREYVTDSEIYNHYTTPDQLNQCFKVIGEISPDATWVKEGDEFDEDEVQFYIYTGAPYEPDFDYPLPIEEWDQAEKMITDFISKTIRIKGPCGHFH
jgi:hypothetical protein